MRLCIVGIALLFLTTAGVAQQPSRWTVSAGPEWTRINRAPAFGGRLRVEYDLITPTRPFRLRLEAGTFWSPTDGYSATYLDGSSVVGSRQSMDVTVGVSAAIAPLPRARISPYVSVAALAQQGWSHGSGVIRNPDGSLASTYPERSFVSGAVLLVPAIGIRARIAGRMFQLEMRQLYGIRGNSRSVTFGTTLPF